MYVSWGRYVDYAEVEKLIKQAQEMKDVTCLDNALEELRGIEVFEGTNISHLNGMLQDENFDYIFSMFDIWLLYGKTHPTHEKWVSYTPIDTEWIPEMLAEVCLGTDIPNSESRRGPGIHIAMSKHGERELKSIGINPHYAPIGINPDQFRPKPEGRKAFRDDFGFDDDTFLIGSVGLNYADDRKGFIPLMRAFKVFHQRHPEARLYIHSHAEGKYPGTVKYIDVIKKLGIQEWVCWPHQASNDIGRIDEEWMVDIYNGLDVFCLPSRGEGFGMPLLESQACGVPAIMTATTTGQELVGETGWLIPVDKQRDTRWLPHRCFRYEVGERPILDTLEQAYYAWKTGEIKRIGQNARQWVVENYSWDVVWNKYWVDVFRDLEDRLKVKACNHKWVDITNRDSEEGKECLCINCNSKKINTDPKE